jgi:hypothetical protein
MKNEAPLFNWEQLDMLLPERLGQEAGRLLGRLVAYQAWSKAQSYFDGTVSSTRAPVASTNQIAIEVPSM